MLLLDPTGWSLPYRNAFVYEAGRIDAETHDRAGVDKYVEDVHDSYDIIEALWTGVDENGKGVHRFALIKGVFIEGNPHFASLSIRRLRYHAHDYDLAYKHWAMYGDGTRIRPEAREYFGRLELRKRYHLPIPRHMARRHAWTLLCNLYVNCPRFGCPDKHGLLEFLPQARQHILTGGYAPWPLLPPDDVSDWEDAMEVYRRIIKPFDVREHREVEDRCGLWIMRECDRLREKRNHGVLTYREAYETGVYAARRFYDEIRQEWPGDDDPDEWSQVHERAFYA
ncbi:hypothetical protein AU375_04080 [Methylobacterium radiotolerans]|nr:hypothetical protein AU375_04080 [Methylobacterium radiotolerans]